MKKNDKFLWVGARLSLCNSVCLALFLSFGVAHNTWAIVCEEGDDHCGVPYYCCAHITEGTDADGNPTKHADIYRSLDAPENAEVKLTSGAFYDKGLTSVTIPDYVVSITDTAFSKNYLKSISLPDSLTSTGNLGTVFGGAVANTNSITEIIISDNIDTSKWSKYFFKNIPEGATILCRGDVEKCKTAMAKYLPNEDGTCPSTNKNCLKNLTGVYAVNSKEQCETGKYNWDATAKTCTPKSEAECNAIKGYYYNGSVCKNRSAKKPVTCVNSSYKLNDGYCDRIRYTPAEAAAVLRDDNTNEVVITFKK